MWSHLLVLVKSLAAEFFTVFSRSIDFWSGKVKRLLLQSRSEEIKARKMVSVPLNFKFSLFHMLDFNLFSIRVDTTEPLIQSLREHLEHSLSWANDSEPELIHVEIRPIPRRTRKLDKPECFFFFIAAFFETCRGPWSDMTLWHGYICGYNGMVQVLVKQAAWIKNTIIPQISLQL